jgi:hypothetical protein
MFLLNKKVKSLMKEQSFSYNEKSNKIEQREIKIVENKEEKKKKKKNSKK